MHIVACTLHNCDDQVTEHLYVYIFCMYVCISPVQVAVGSSSMVASHVCTLVNALVGTSKTPPVQVAGSTRARCG